MRRPARAVRGLAALVLASGLLAGCGGDSGEEILPDGRAAPRAYTERYLREHPRAVLRPSHLLVAEVTPGDAADRFAYQLPRGMRLTLEVEPDAEAVDGLVLRDARGTEVGRSGAGEVALAGGRHELEIRPRAAAASRQTVFVRPLVLPDGSVTLRASKNCVDCCFEGSQLEGQNFDGVDLSGSTFCESDISNSTFRGATMVNCILSGFAAPTYIDACDFSGADLSGAHFDFTNIGQSTVFGGPAPTPPANLSNTSFGGVQALGDEYVVGLVEEVFFTNATMVGAKFTGTILVSVDFRGADLSGSDFTATGTLVTGTPRQTQCMYCLFSPEPSSGEATNLQNAVLGQPGSSPLLVLEGNSLRGANLAASQLESVAFGALDFTGADFTQANLSGAQLGGANLTNANLTDATLDGAVLDGAELGGARIDGTRFAHASLEGLDLYERDLHGLTFSSASLRGTNLDYADLSGADLSGAILGVPLGSSAEPASMIGVYMPNVDLTGADLRGVDLSGAHLYGDTAQTSLNQALLDGATLAGAICSGAQFTEASLAGAVLDGAQLVNCSFVEADLTDASMDSTYLQGADFSAAASVAGVRLSNAAVSTMPGSWTFTEQNGMPVEYSYGATQLGGIATQSDVICPDGASGPCVGDKLDPVMNGPFPPIPTCVPLPPNYNNCSAPAAPPTPTPPPAAASSLSHGS